MMTAIKGVDTANELHQRHRRAEFPAFLKPAPLNVSFYSSVGFQIGDQQQRPDRGPVIWFRQTPLTAAKPFLLAATHPLAVVATSELGEFAWP